MATNKQSYTFSLDGSDKTKRTIGRMMGQSRRTAPPAYKPEARASTRRNSLKPGRRYGT